MRVVSWNIANRVGDAARRQGEFLADLDPRPDLVMLQEVNRRSIERVSEHAGALASPHRAPLSQGPVMA
jgi:endonuclease/exonuclease/phosphatase family metal-dependent hydrolase